MIAVAMPLSAMAIPAKVPATSLTWKARAVPIPWAVSYTHLTLPTILRV